MAHDPGRIHAAIDDPSFVERFGHVSGGHLKRVPSGFPPDHPDAELLTLKDVTFGRRLSDTEAYSAELPDLMADDLSAAVPLVRILAWLGT